MINFQYARATDVADAVRLIAADPTAKLIAGGTNLIDLMKADVERPARDAGITDRRLNAASGAVCQVTRTLEATGSLSGVDCDLIAAVRIADVR